MCGGGYAPPSTTCVHSWATPALDGASPRKSKDRFRKVKDVPSIKRHSRKIGMPTLFPPVVVQLDEWFGLVAAALRWHRRQSIRDLLLFTRARPRLEPLT